MAVGNFPGKLFVIGFVVIPTDALLWHAGGAAGFENIVGTSLVLCGDPDLGLQVAQPFVLEMREACRQVRKSLNFLARIPAGLFCPLKPKGRAGFGRKM